LSYFKTNTVWLGEIFEASGVTQSHSKLEKFSRYTKSYVYPFYLVLTTGLKL